MPSDTSAVPGTLLRIPATSWAMDWRVSRSSPVMFTWIPFPPMAEMSMVDPDAVTSQSRSSVASRTIWAISPLVCSRSSARRT